jgi:hypothetical protein
MNYTDVSGLQIKDIPVSSKLKYIFSEGNMDIIKIEVLTVQILIKELFSNKSIIGLKKIFKDRIQKEINEQLEAINEDYKKGLEELVEKINNQNKPEIEKMNKMADNKIDEFLNDNNNDDITGGK